MTGSFFSGAAHDAEDVPVAVEGLLVAEANAADGDGHGVAGVVFDILEEEEVLPQLFLRYQVRRLVIVFAELAHGAHITLLSSRGQASEAADTRSFSFAASSWLHLLNEKLSGPVSCQESRAVL